MTITTCNGAKMAGFTKKMFVEAGDASLHVMVRPDADFDGVVPAFCTDEMEMIRVNGWACDWSEV